MRAPAMWYSRAALAAFRRTQASTLRALHLKALLATSLRGKQPVFGSSPMEVDLGSGLPADLGVLLSDPVDVALGGVDRDSEAQGDALHGEPRGVED